jgi:hypothetical protein
MKNKRKIQICIGIFICSKTHVNTMLKAYKAEITDLESLLDFPEKHVFDDSSEGYTA